MCDIIRYQKNYGSPRRIAGERRRRRTKGETMNATINYNTEHNGIEISFDGKPSAEIRDELKAAGFRWLAARRLWYAVRNAKRDTLAEKIANGEPIRHTTEPNENGKAPRLTIDREALRAEFAKVWKDTKTIDYCTNKALNTVTMDDGTILVIDKKAIETRFCFGEDGYDYDEAAASAQHARTSCEYLKRENMRHFDEWLETIDGTISGEGRFFVTIRGKRYTGQANGCKLGHIELRRDVEVLNDLGGSAYLAELPGQTITEAGSGSKYYIPTRDELARIRSAYEAARAAHEKKVDAYIKRYGTSKVHSWTYWRNA